MAHHHKKLLPTIAVDWEMKFLAIALAYAIIKFIGDNVAFLYASRTFFFVGNLAFLYYYLAAVKSIGNDSSLLSEEKANAKTKCFSVLKSLFMKAIVVGAIHFKSNLIQPLYVSVFLGLFTLLENGHIYRVMYQHCPRFYDFFFY